MKSVSVELVVCFVFLLTFERGVSQTTCRDAIDTYSCYHWLVNGMCTDHGYRNLMYENCRKTCNLCPVVVPVFPTCKDNRKACLRWRDESHCIEYSRYYDFMRTNCRRTCLFCEDVQCADRKDKCLRYRNLGYCPRNHQYHKFMKKNCAKTCKFCLAKKTEDNEAKTRIEETYAKQYPCDFETDECEWSNQQFEDTANWAVGIDNYHGPAKGHNNSVKYLYLDTQGEGYYAYLWLPWELVLPDNEKDKGKMCLHFWYQMDGGKITVSVKANPVLTDKYTKASVQQTIERKVGSWTHAKVAVYVSDRYQLIIKGTKGHPETYMAIDNLFFTRGQC